MKFWILLRLSGCKNMSTSPRNGPLQVRQRRRLQKSLNEGMGRENKGGYSKKHPQKRDEKGTSRLNSFTIPKV